MVDFLLRARTLPARPLMERFRSVAAMADIPGLLPGLVPALRAYSGLQVPDARSSRETRSLGRLGNLEVLLAGKATDVRRAQKLRYRVFYKEMSAIADAATLFARRDIDAFDAICDHLLVVDHARSRHDILRKPEIVGTYRLLRQHIAERHGGFYSAAEFDIEPLLRRHRHLRFLELGRSCVLSHYRNKRTVELLWQGIWNYVVQHRQDVMIGCASLEGTNPDRLALPLSFLHHFARAPEEWRARTVDARHVEMNRVPKDAIDPKTALKQLPPLIKGYLRLGAFVGEGAVVDDQFGTTDILIILPISAINARYLTHFGAVTNDAAPLPKRDGLPLS